MGTKKGDKIVKGKVFANDDYMGAAPSQIIKMYEAGEFVLREEVEKQKKEQRRKVPLSLVNQTMIYFLDSCIDKARVDDETFDYDKIKINGAITDMLKRKDGHYKFKVISDQIPRLSNWKDDDRKYEAEVDFLENQVRERYVNLEGVKLQIKLMTEGLKIDDPHFYLQHGYSDADKKKYPKINEWFFI